MAQSQFLNDFQNQMDRLTKIREQIQTSVQFKEKFTNDLKSRLVEINEKIVKLSVMINDLKTKASKLEDQVKTNTSSIGDKETELQKYKDLVSALTSEKAKLEQDAIQQQEENRRKIDELQAKINEYEANLRKLEEQKKISQLELGAFVTGSNSKGDSEQARAEAIKSATAEFQTMLENKEKELIEKIANYDAKIRDLEQQIKDKDAELTKSQEVINTEIGQAQTSAQGLQQQIEALTEENKNLTDRIIAATKAINQANDQLENIVNTVPNAKTKEEVDALLNEITQKLELSIQNIDPHLLSLFILPS
jgi:exonuclease SbcC